MLDVFLITWPLSRACVRPINLPTPAPCAVSVRLFVPLIFPWLKCVLMPDRPWLKINACLLRPIGLLWKKCVLQEESKRPLLPMRQAKSKARSSFFQAVSWQEFDRHRLWPCMTNFVSWNQPQGYGWTAAELLPIGVGKIKILSNGLGA